MKQRTTRNKSKSKKPTHLDKKNTDNYPSAWCYPRRQCGRIATCPYCWNRTRSFVLGEFEKMGAEWNLTKMVTASVLGQSLIVIDALFLLGELRKSILRRLVRDQIKYVSVAAIGRVRFTPHIHLALATEATNDELKRFIKNRLRHFAPELNYAIHIRPIFQTPYDLRRMGGYLLDQNVRPYLRLRPRRMRLITASRGFLFRRPRDPLKWKDDIPIRI